MIAHLTPTAQTHFLTGTAAPCTSVFKPVWIDAGLPDTGPEPAGTYDEASLFWRHEVLHRATLRDYGRRIRFYAGERDELEREFIGEALACSGAAAAERAAFSAQCFAQADEAERRWWERVSRAMHLSDMGPLYAAAWRRFNREAELPALP